MTIRRYGCRRDTRDARDEAHAFRPKGIRVPVAVDLRKWCPPVMDQGDLGACTAHGILGALRFLMIKRGMPDVELSRLALYYQERFEEGTTSSDAGAEIRTGIKCVNKNGAALESIWPYDPARFADPLPGSIYDDGAFRRALVYQRVQVGSAPVKQALASGFPVIIGISLYDSFEGDEVAKTGVVPMPNIKKEQLAGGHCMYAVGYGQRPGYFTVRNSWNTDWGDKGDCYIPESMIGSASYGSDYWMIQSEG